uniref:Uncharacterized protein AlNc14C290G10225 n=1 Tax=Albugo laibachii Nc14 TaxID=890382 RepID=F0WV80_9STRA|nr:conserved hypothetical protein [Albugo laibachii Nc14]|eukprot:CCA25319.1 conserved hypothetical protein [Albugo laibachii Nc14]
MNRADSSISESSTHSAGTAPDDENTPRKSLYSLPTTPVNTDSMVELAQICHFCQTFRVPLKLPEFTRTELVSALRNIEKDAVCAPFLAELHYRLARDAVGVKLDKMRQDWERSVARKVSENWMLFFSYNPMPVGTSYSELSIENKIGVLNALCHWKIETCGDIRKFINSSQKEDEIDYDRFRTKSIGQDDKGSVYWYFDDACWVYAEKKMEGDRGNRLGNRFYLWRLRIASWLMNKVFLPMRCCQYLSHILWFYSYREANYCVEFADSTRIRLSLNFDLEDKGNTPEQIKVEPKIEAKPTEENDKVKHEEDLASLKHEERKDTGDSEAVNCEQNGKHEIPDPKTKKETTIVHAIGSKKRFIIDDDSSGSDESESSPQLSVILKSKKVKIEDVTAEEPSECPAISRPAIACDPAESTETFNILCASCRKDYDMRYLDPPLDIRPKGEWRCFECLVNDARGWPRRRRPCDTPTKADQARNPFKKNPKLRKHKAKSNSNLDRKHTKPKKKHKKSSQHRSSHCRTHRRRYHEEYRRLLDACKKRKRLREKIQADRMQMRHIEVPRPCTWRVVSSSLESLRRAIESLLGGSLEQERLRGRLICILKHQEAVEFERHKRQEMLYENLPRRQSSRIAMTRIKRQSGGDHDGDSSEPEGMPLGDSKQRLAMERASRARRRQREVDTSSEDENGDDADDWMDWLGLKSQPENALSTLCMTIIQRLLHEELAELFARPVDPETDGCVDYLDRISNPMDLGTVRIRVQQHFYQSWEMFKSDVELVWHNCETYNARDSVIVSYANTLRRMFGQMCKCAERHGARTLSDTKMAMESENEEDSVGISNEDAWTMEGSSGHSSEDTKNDSSDSTSQCPRSIPRRRRKIARKSSIDSDSQSVSENEHKVVSESSDEGLSAPPELEGSHTINPPPPPRTPSPVDHRPPTSLPSAKGDESPCSSSSSYFSSTSDSESSEAA